MEQLNDHSARQRFAQEVDQPFSVIAPAGVGKTHSIIERVATMIKANNDPVALVTYTKKAAEEMRARLQSRLKKDGTKLFPERLFVGTIHALCAEMMDRHALAWELPVRRQIFADPQELWRVFLQEVPNPLDSLAVSQQKLYLAHFQGFPVELILAIDTQKETPPLSPPPAFDFQKLLSAQIKGPAARTHQRLKDWVGEFLQLAQIKEFVMPALPQAPEETSALWPLYQEVFGPYLQWRSTQGMIFARAMALRFERWRQTRGSYLYDDLIAITLRNTAEGQWSVVLDEAQDTSPAQLALLKKLSLLRDGRRQFTLVGDPQQSIYASRASLPDYLRLHDQLTKTENTQALTFNVTFRCAQNIVHWVNTLGGRLLPGGLTQAQFVPLSAKPNAPEGEVVRWPLLPVDLPPDANTEERDWLAAEAFAERFCALQLNPAELHQVAVLAPRKDWLFKLAEKLTARGVRVELHAQNDSASPAQRILSSIVYLLAHPYDSFELVGFLRELSELDDLTLAHAAQESPAALTLLAPPNAAEIPAPLFEVLDELYRARQSGLTQNLEQALATFIQVARLDERVAALDVAYAGTLLPAWRQTKARVLAQAGGKTWDQLWQELQSETVETAVTPGALQLMTMHKAKGLEWRAVFLPFLHRPLNLRPPSYPAPDPADPHGKLSWKIPTELTALPEEENFRRLLYVALTRAKESLVLVDDATFYPPGFSPAQLLQIHAAGAFHSHFQALPTQLTITLPTTPTPVVPVPPGGLWQTRGAALPVVTPSGLALSHDDETPTETPPVADKAGAPYGEAWHGLWHRVVLQRPADIAEFFVAQAQSSPFAERLIKEFEQLQRSPLWPQLQKLENCQGEVPFVAQMQEQVMEGRVDLIIYNPDGILVVDWKTDHLPPAELLRRYQPQLVAYEQALGTLLQKPVRAVIYSTVHGSVLHAV